MTVSVAMCTYNGACYIEEQIDSILRQTYSPHEIIICDDQSTDNTIEILKSVKEKWGKNTNINIIINNSRLGIAKNFEKAISLCSEELIFLSDQDDIWYPQKIEKIIAFFIEHPKTNVIFSNADILINKDIYRKTLYDILNFDQKAQFFFKKGFEFELLNITNRIIGATLAFRADFIKRHIPFPKFNEMIHDEIISLYAIKTHSLSFITDCLICYRQHQSQVVGLNSFLNNIPTSDVLQYRPIRYSPKAINIFMTENKRNIYDYRAKCIKSIWGLFYMLFGIRLYKITYMEYFPNVIKKDITLYFDINKRRIMTRIGHIFHKA